MSLCRSVRPPTTTSAGKRRCTLSTPRALPPPGRVTHGAAEHEGWADELSLSSSSFFDIAQEASLMRAVRLLGATSAPKGDTDPARHGYGEEQTTKLARCDCLLPGSTGSLQRAVESDGSEVAQFHHRLWFLCHRRSTRASRHLAKPSFPQLLNVTPSSTLHWTQHTSKRNASVCWSKGHAQRVNNWVLRQSRLPAIPILLLCTVPFVSIEPDPPR